MVRLLGVGGKKKNRKKLLQQSARTPEGIRDQHPSYQFALNEYAQTVQPGSSNDDGRRAQSTAHEFSSSHEDTEAHIPEPSTISVNQGHSDQPLQSNPTLNSHRSNSNGPCPHGPLSTVSRYPSELRSRAATLSPVMNLNNAPYSLYEESYGEAYIGGSIKYLYPSGYTSMRPRSCPWKLSIVILLLFTWLSVFIIAHCSDVSHSLGFSKSDDLYYFCGNHMAKLAWTGSMLVTGLSAAYCSVIGYIKCRDFVVANSRSQPPGVSEGKSDYYMQIDDNGILPAFSNGSDTGNFHSSIYQADGNPLFWGSQIYRPTQAAVAITSR